MFIKKEEVTSTYIGKAGHCTCGCSGKFYKTKRIPGKLYGLVDKQMSDKVIKFINSADRSDLDVRPYYFSLTIGKTVYIAYLD